MTFYIENETKAEFLFSIEDMAEKVIKEVLQQEKCPYDTTVNILLTDNEGIRTFNKEYRNIDKETDVLSFPNIPYESPADFSKIEEKKAEYFDLESKELVLGDIILSVDKVKEQAKSYGHSEQREFAFLIAHSMLHLCGYDHMEEQEENMMEDKQEKILTSLAITRE